jgi:hypothetical protein
VKTIRLLIISAVAFAFVALQSARATPAQIIFLRHAEKPAVGSELSPTGQQRARALVTLFTQDARTLEHGPAVAIYAMAPAKAHGSVRALQTMEPTARALHLTLESRFTREEIAPLVRAISTAPGLEGKTVIVCWEHNVIPEMLKAFGWTQGPKKWHEDVYDRLWVLDFSEGKPVRFRDLPQKVLPEDGLL